MIYFRKKNFALPCCLPSIVPDQSCTFLLLAFHARVSCKRKIFRAGFCSRVARGRCCTPETFAWRETNCSRWSTWKTAPSKTWKAVLLHTVHLHPNISRVLYCLLRVKPIKSLYIDTTFCSPDAAFIPTREESAQVVTQLVGKLSSWCSQRCSCTVFLNAWCFLEEWIGRGDEHTILLDHAAAIGYEQIYRRLFEHFHMKVRYHHCLTFTCRYS